MTMTSIKFHIDFQELSKIQTLLNTPPAVRMKELEYQFSRTQDFSQSHSGLNYQFSKEYIVAINSFGKAKSTQELMNIVSNGLHKHNAGDVHSLGDDRFDSFRLAAYLRHFLNDSCRLLEPFIPILQAKNTHSKVEHPRSFKSHMEYWATQSVSYDAEYLAELYELWNHYKHRNTRSPGVGYWVYKSGKIEKPDLTLPDDSFTKMKNLKVDEFVELTSKKIREFIEAMI